MQNRLVFFVVVIAIILAIAGFLLVSFLTRGDGTAEPEVDQPGVGETPGGGQPQGVPVQVDGTTVFLRTLPERAVTISQAPPVVEPTLPGPLPTAQPIETVALPTVPVVQPTAAPPVTGGGGDRVIFIDYVVQQGDTLYSISDTQATSIELMSVHGISAEDLVPGTTLRLPVGNPAVCSGASVYVVRPGDTVFSIARRYNTTTQAIQSANGLGADFRINVAQVICIP